jgi:hypothetical protein
MWRRPLANAFSLLPDRFADNRHGAIEAGLEAAGWRIEKGYGPPRSPEDVLVTWTVHRGAKERAARAFEAAGGRVVVCEEAYFREIEGERHFAIALHDHNGAGRWRCGGPERWVSFGIEVKPWRNRGEHIVVREQRGIGSERMASPPLWHDRTSARLRELSKRPVVLRRHPKIDPGQAPLAELLNGAHAVVTWASSIAAQALVLGVPVIYEAPRIVCASACNRGLDKIETLAKPDRLPALERLAWAQWSVSEIARGDPFRFLMAR